MKEGSKMGDVSPDGEDAFSGGRVQKFPIFRFSSNFGGKSKTAAEVPEVKKTESNKKFVPLAKRRGFFRNSHLNAHRKSSATSRCGRQDSESAD